MKLFYFQVYFGYALSRFYVAFNALDLCCVTGMSYIFRKSLLDQVNGLEWYGKFLAEDFFLTRALHDKYDSVIQVLSKFSVIYETFEIVCFRYKQ